MPKHFYDKYEMKKFMDLHKISQGKMSEDLGLTQGALSLKINGKREFSLKDVERFIESYEGFVDDIMDDVIRIFFGTAV